MLQNMMSKIDAQEKIMNELSKRMVKLENEISGAKATKSK